MKKLFASIVSLFVLITAALVYSSASDVFFQQPAEDADEVSIEIRAGSNVRMIAAALAQQQVIDKPRLFEWYVRLKGATRDVQAGVFTLKKGMNHAQVLKQLIGTSFAKEIAITIPEGYRLEQMGDVFASHLTQVTPQAWTEAVLHPQQFVSEFPFLEHIPSGHGMEGYLFADTYRFREDATAQEVVRRLLSTFKQRLEGLGIDPEAKAITHGLTLHEFLTLASIVEREVRQPDTMAMVADIFLKRLDIGMALQADSTVNYVTGGNDPGVSIAATQIDSPYNTYKYPGLPPGPIAAPSQNALKAVLSPIENPYFYFLTDKNGDIFYGRTFAEHNQNRAAHLK